MHFHSSYKTLLTLSGSYSKKIAHTFLQLTSNTTDLLRELLVQNTTHFSRVYIKQYWHFKRVPSKLNYSKNLFPEFISKTFTSLTFSESYYYTILLIYSELEYQTVFTLSELLPNNNEHVFESFNEHLNRQNILKLKIP